MTTTRELGGPPDYSRPAELDPIPMPGGRLAPARAWNYGMALLSDKLAKAEGEARAAVAVELLRCCVPSITDDELAQLPIDAFDEIPLYCASTLRQAEAALEKNASAGPAATPAATRSRRSTRTTSTPTR